nr:hypothetical protein [Actinomycetota bacterium]
AAVVPASSEREKLAAEASGGPLGGRRDSSSEHAPRRVAATSTKIRAFALIASMLSSLREKGSTGFASRFTGRGATGRCEHSAYPENRM